uniref:Uncharacterized protein n=1 Tax=Anguilla anguilla TaxID=7936 RepID=A0A0E9XG60_ANGAN
MSGLVLLPVMWIHMIKMVSSPKKEITVCLHLPKVLSIHPDYLAES